jgi:hypothetical protein
MRTVQSILASALLVLSLTFAVACDSDSGGGQDTTSTTDSGGADGSGSVDVVDGPNCACGARQCGAHPNTNDCPGVSCGSCGAGSSCDLTSGVCVADRCACGERVCGPHPDTTNCAGTSCGTCTTGVCTAAGLCIDCVPECGTRECGLDPVCETSCGTCGTGETCEDGVCTVCTPQCGTRQCGVDPVCGQSCGTCNAGENCVNGQCIVVVVNPFGGYCLESNDCHGDVRSTGAAATPTYPDCLDLKCETGECWGWWCTQACTPEKDEVNNLTGAPTPDGVEDADSTSTQCDGAANDAFAGPFRCVNLAQPSPGSQPIAFCFAGSDFRRCTANSDCPTGESCQVMLIAGALTTFCLQQPKDAVGIAEDCNSSPLEGDVAFCETDLCFGIGCTEFCKVDEDCATYAPGRGCSGGTCADDPQIACTTNADCSAWTCVRDLPIFSNDPSLFDICLGRDCFDNAGCRDSDFYCRLFGNFEDGMDPADFMWTPACQKRPEGSVDVGEACDDDPNDNVEGPVCHSDFCISGYCSAFCTADDDCAMNLGQRCVVYEWPLDLDDDGEDDHFEPIGLCYTIGNVDASSPACASQGDCPAGTTCSIFQTGDYSRGMGGETDIGGVCKTDAAGDLGYFEACGLDDTQQCAGAGWLYQCFESNPNEGIPGYCSIACETSADCPAGNFFDGTPVKGVCETMYFGYNGTYDPADPSSRADDLFINFCRPEIGDSSLDDCSADFTCADANEACLPNQVLYGPTKAPVVEWLCFEAFDAENPRPTGQPGAACTDGRNCASLFCINETEAANAGYCSAFCNDNADCAGITGATCVQDVWFDRAGDEFDLIVPNCQVAR